MNWKNLSQPEKSAPDAAPFPLGAGEPSLFGLFEDILNRGLHLRVRVTGRSMAPFLQGGEILTIRKVPCAFIGRGDLIFFKNPMGLPIIHRIIKERRSHRRMKSFQTKGDAIATYDDLVQYSEVIGKVIKIERTHPTAGCRSIDMESMRWKTINYLIAATFHLRAIACRSAELLFRPFRKGQPRRDRVSR